MLSEDMEKARKEERIAMHKKNRVQGWAVPWIPVPAFASYGTVNWTPTSCG